MSTLFTTLLRPGDTEELDVAITFTTTVHGRYIPATYWEPAEYPELEHEFVSAEPDGWEGPLTDAEVAQMREWFEAHTSDADEACTVEDTGPDPDEMRERHYEYEQEARADRRMWGEEV